VVASTLQLISEGATHIGIASDHVIESFRNDLWPGYKTSAGMDPELLEQIPLMEQALAAAGFTVWPMVEFEYTLSENGRVLKSDTVRLSDMGYLQGGFFTAAQQSTHLRYERRMLDRWYRDTIEGRKR